MVLTVLAELALDGCEQVDGQSDRSRIRRRELRAQLISVGLFLIKTVEEIRAGRSSNFAAVIDVSQTIADGLA